MWKYVVRRFIGLIPILLGTMFIVFMVLHLSPSDPAAFALGEDASPEAIWEWNESRGLNDPVLIQYARYVAMVFWWGDFGTSFRNNVDVSGEIMARFPHTIRLGLVALSAALILALPIGILAAVKKNTWIDNASMFVALIGISIPVFWLGLILVLYLFWLGRWHPWSPGRDWPSFILPGITLGAGMLGAMIRTTRSSILEVMKQDYIKMAQAKGLTKSNVMRKYAIHNAFLPILTGFSTHLGAFITSIILAENIFAWPGIGRLMTQGIAARDYPMVLGCLFMFIFFYAIINIVVDIARTYLDPQVRTYYKLGN
ncbi:MAG: ABC transporter permease [Defluviitaleaceae bacterium]|nr:ABC transporter permease [Defluviitaleaceae bacterium]